MLPRCRLIRARLERRAWRCPDFLHRARNKARGGRATASSTGATTAARVPSRPQVFPLRDVLGWGGLSRAGAVWTFCSGPILPGANHQVSLKGEKSSFSLMAGTNVDSKHRPHHLRVLYLRQWMQKLHSWHPLCGACCPRAPSLCCSSNLDHSNSARELLRIICRVCLRKLSLQLCNSSLDLILGGNICYYGRG